MFSSRTQRIAAGAAAAVGIALGAAGISGAATSTSTPTRPAVHQPAPASENAGKPDTDNVQQGDQSGPDHETEAADVAGAKEPDAGKPDTDNVQQGPGDTTDGGVEIPGD